MKMTNMQIKKSDAIKLNLIARAIEKHNSDVLTLALDTLKDKLVKSDPVYKVLLHAYDLADMVADMMQ